ncbi:MAG: oligosaccharide flippase family protein [Bacteroides pyogenes]|uniref:oligosaccharide flippase family protein n=1 Tax=Bacteroides pyogenes TaxID=310300 RepID=UPI00242AB5E4|nr:oligosaccharide flippase family protein [Bacteroides pyogenes]MCI7070641.1 oligosaccharide flippase family protein [Bacteroides pyogenes]
MNKQESYKQIVKNTGLFGGVEILRILLNVLQTKVIALLLGPAGVGIINMFSIVINMFVSGFGFGLNTSAVKEVAQAKASNDEDTIGRTIISLRRIIGFSAIVGAIVMIVFSHTLSVLTFGNSDYSFQFVILSLSVIFNITSNGQYALIKGMRFLKYLAKCSLLGTSVSLLVSIPFYYWLGKNGIVYVIVITSFSVLCFSWFYSRKIEFKHVSISFKESFIVGKDMLKMGFFLMLSTFLAQLTSFVINAYISNEGAIEDVGFYRAGFLVTSHYVGLIFSAMSADFLPRLTAANKDPQQLSTIVHQQTELAVLIIMPLIAFLFPLVRIFINILYSSEFYCIESYIEWAAIGLIARAYVWTLSYVLLANGESKKFFISEVFYNLTYIILCVLGYNFYSISGLGLAFLIHNFMCFLFNFYLVHKYCNFNYNKKLISYIVLTTIISILLFTINHFWAGIGGKIIIVSVALSISCYSIITIKNNTGLKFKRFTK